MTTLQQITSCMDAYDPDALAVDQARAVVRAFLTPVATNAEHCICVQAFIPGNLFHL